MEKQINVPKLRFPEFKGEWEKKKLGEVFSIFNGYAFASNESVENGTLWVKIADVGIQEMKKDNLSFLPISFNKKHSKFLLKKGDFVIALTRPILNGKLKMAQIDDFFNDSLLNQRVGKIETNNSKEFIYSYLQKDDLIKAIENNIAGSDPPNLSPSEINTIQLAIPSFPEQSRIASFFAAIDEKLKLETQRLASLKQYKKGVMQKLFSQELRFKDENGKEFPKWEVKKLGEISKIKTGKLDANAMVENGEYRFYTCAKDYFKIDKYAFDTEALLISGNGANVGYIHYFKGKFNAYQRTYILDGFKENIIYIKFYLQKFLSTRIDSEKKEGNTPYIVLSALSEMKILLPSLPEQTKIANFLSSIDDKIDQAEKRLQRIQMYKKGLLQQMFV